MAAPIGASVKMYLDTEDTLEEGDYLQTPTLRTYLITHVRVQERGQHAGTRKHLRVVVCSYDSAEPGAKVIPIQWYKR